MARRILGGRAALRSRIEPGREIHLAADDRLDPGLLRRLVKLDGPEHVAMIGHRHRRHAVADGLLHQVLDADRTVEQRILRVEMEMYERIVGGSDRDSKERQASDFRNVRFPGRKCPAASNSSKPHEKPPYSAIARNRRPPDLGWKTVGTVSEPVSWLRVIAPASRSCED